MNHSVAWILESACCCAVNCYALISGYVGVDARFKYSNIMKLWLQVVFYTLGITAVFLILSPEVVGRGEIYAAICPVRYDQYWYFTAYFCIAFFIPFFNALVNALSIDKIKVLFLTVFLLFSLLPTVWNQDVFKTGNGYSAIWLAVLYVIGACVKKGQMLHKPQFWKLLGIYLVCVVLGAFTKSERWTAYTSPLIFCAGIALFLIFINLKIPRWAIKVIAFLSPLTFSVYLIHVHPLIWTYVLRDVVADFGQYETLKMVLAVGCATMVIYFACSLIDLIRVYIFKWMKIGNFCVRTENFLKG